MKNDEQQERRASDRMEKHIQTVLTGIAIVLLAWFGNTLVDIRDRIARQEERTSILNAQIQTLTQQAQVITDGRYSNADARRDFDSVWKSYRDIESRLERLERRRS